MKIESLLSKYRLLFHQGWLRLFVAFSMLLAVTAWGQGAATSTTLSAATTSIVAGTTNHYTITVTSGTKTVIGRVLLCDATAAFCEGPAILADAQLAGNSGSAVIPLALGPGTHSLKASFAGNKSFLASTSSTLTITPIGGRTTSTALAAVKQTSGYNFTATLTGAGVQPMKGTVSFVDGTDGNVAMGSTTPGASITSVKFISAPTAATGTAPLALAVADFNGDGVPDVAVANESSNSVTVLLGTRSGAFEDSGLSLTTGNDPSGIVTLDFNRDGIPDLAVANSGDNTVSFFSGKGDGSFVLNNTASVGRGPVNMVVADFNRDGLPDLAVVNRLENTITILLNTGTGFSPSSTKPATGSNPQGIATGDFNTDGIPDLVVVNDNSNTASVLMGHGDGTFAAPVSFTTATGPIAVVVGDFNGDGHDDLAIASSNSETLSVYVGNGAGQFTSSASLPTENNPSAIAIGDFNGDGKQDLVVSNYGSSSMDVFLGKGNGTFAPVLSWLVGTSPAALAVADANADGITDVIVVNAALNQVRAMLNISSTTATATMNNLIPHGTASQLDFASLAADTNYAASTSNNVSVTGTLIPTSTGIYVGATAAAIGETVQVEAQVTPYLYESRVASAQLVLFDGSTSVATAAPVNGFASFNAKLSSLGTHTLYVAYPGDGPFAASSSKSIPISVVASTATATTLTTSATSVPHGTVVVLTAKVTSGGVNVTRGTVSFCKAAAARCADLNLLASAQLTANGTATARLALPAGSTAIQARFKGAAVLTASTSSTQTVTVTGNYPVAIALSASGAPGNYTVTANVTGQSGQPLPFSPLQLTDTSNGNLGLGAAYLSPNQAPFSLKTTLNVASGENYNRLATGDFNNDGKMDALVWYGSKGAVSVLLGNGDGTFQVSPSTISLPVISAIAVGDFNGDGNLDFIAAEAANNVVDVELGNGDGTFTRKSSLSTSAGPAALAVADFNNDGILDIAVTNAEYTSSSVAILLGNGDGTFAPEPISTNILYPFAISATDFDGDGNVDLAVASYPAGLVLLYGYGDGTFRAGPTVTTGFLYGYSIASGDFDGDGLPDIALGGMDAGSNYSVKVLLNQGGAFQVSATLPGSGTITNVVATDFNGDGILDLIFPTYSTPSTLSFASGFGNGLFSVATQALSPTIPANIAVADFDQDGTNDLFLNELVSINKQLVESSALYLNRSMSTATFSNVSIPGSGAHLVQAIAPAGGAYAAGASNAVSLTGTPVTPAVLVIPSPSSTVATGQAVTITVSVLPTDNFIATGSVSLYDGATLLKTATLTNGQITDTVTFTAVGTHNLSATYGGSASLTTASSAITPLYVAAASSTTLSLSSIQVAAGTPVQLTATTVNSAKASATAGTVNFCIATATVCQGSALLGTAQVNTAGTARLTFTPAIGSYSIKAIFLGTQTLLSSSSVAASLTVTGLKQSTTALTATGSGGTFALTATVTANGTQPVTGAVNFTNTTVNTSLGQATVTTGATQLNFIPSVYSLPIDVIPAGGSLFDSRFVVGDFNNDGTPDLIILDSIHSSISLMVGNANGGFSWYNGISLPAPFNSIAIGDFNGDGNLDIVLGSSQTTTGSQPTSSVCIMLGDGNSHFTPMPNVTIPGVANQIAVGDFNHDGKPDILILGFSQTISVLTGDGTGRFTVTELPSSQAMALLSVTLADFNGDGNLDAAVTTYGKGVQIYLGNGAGGFTLSTIPLLPTAQPGDIVSADFNKDGKIDLAVTDYASSSVILLFGRGDGTFTQGATIPSGWLPSHLAVGDFNLDGNLDLVVSSDSSNNFAYLLGNGAGVFTTHNVTLPAKMQPSGLAVADLNHDGQADVVLGDQNPNTVNMLIDSLTTTATATLAQAKITGTASQNVTASYTGSAAYAASTSTPLTLIP
jgi:hypothetical protein